jgi:hypothetical protein
MPEKTVIDPTKRAHAITLAVWAVGIGLQLAAPLLRDRVTLSDDLFITSMIAPAWSFLQLCLLAGALRLTRRRVEGWSSNKKALHGSVAAAVFMLLQPGFVSLAVNGTAGLASDRVALALLWSTPLALYIVPAAIVVWAWARSEGRVSLPRALGYGLVAQGAINFGFILWLGRLWELYFKTQTPTGP